MSDTRTINAKCRCGNFDLPITLPAADFPLKAYLCHCDSCRHMTGTLALMVIFLKPTHFQPPQEVLDKLKSFVFSKRITQYHCPTCGCFTIASVKKYPDDDDSEISWDVATGTLESADASALAVQGHEHLQDTLDGGFADFFPKANGKPIDRWPSHFGDDDELPPFWRDEKVKRFSPTSTKPGDPSKRLHAHCKCGGVDLWVARPSAKSDISTAPLPDVIVPATGEEPADASKASEDAWWHRANGTKYLASLCVCDSCRLVSGMEVVEWTFVPIANISLDAEGKKPLDFTAGTLKAYKSSSDVTRYFCNGCGALVFYTCQDRPQVLDLAVGLIAAEEGARAETWLEWETSRLSYREDGIVRNKALVEGIEAALPEYKKAVMGKK
ncbi:hypothetical protein K431DRAFT_281939 [Polychaeton citri CBS 116435]|uniref:CENP-V/GFA domain-containing protein n=1 Tax=Polychaeton citri CBS 116435 TaxID=1314669 RepID=A0A9P4QGK8_9PEZI|nr:hypothetical protein K431DRAFT_281939 [Polychaeton citri CBS 116435]